MKNRNEGKTGIFTDDFYPHIGGIGRYVYEISQRLPRHQVLIFSPCQNHIPNHIRLRPFLHKYLRNISLSVWADIHLNRLIRTYHLSGINLQCGPGGLFLFKKPRVPLVVTCHHTYWQQVRHIPAQSWKKVFILFENHTYRIADKIICVSEDTRQILTKRYDIPSQKTVVIPNGVSTDRFYPIPSAPRIPTSLLFVGRLDKRKGIDFLLRSMPLLRERLPGIRLFVGGKGRDSEKIEAYIARHRLRKNVTLLGYIPEDRLNEWYNRVECVVVPSLFEGFGLTAIEAMAAGTPVIATDADGLRGIIENNSDGFLVPYGDPLRLSQKISDLISDRQLQERIRLAGRDKTERIYNWDNIVSLTAKELNQLFSC